ncbi:BT_3044 domain-containing protein [Geofilum sp. OHC36d9]|uniref:BT_3044 domain-containing protein n=1 Tax=Geofilum sp. OHC36d9 TaxID=3458413 RepID=UPI00403475D4
MRNRFIILLCIALSLLTVGCVEDPLDSEQYKKLVYLVGAVDELQTKDIYYTSEEEQDTYIAVAVGGSLPTTSDVTVSLAEWDEAIEKYNKKYIASGKPKYHKLLPEFYSVPNMDCIISAGETYARIPIKIRAHELDPDSLYMLSFKIESSSNEISDPDQVLLFSFQMKNRFSGTYKLSIKKTEWFNGGVVGTPSLITSIRQLKAIDENTIRYFNLADSEDLSKIAESCLKISVNSIDNTLTIEGWDQLVISQGGGKYDPIKQTFDIWYVYSFDGKDYKVEGTLTNIEMIKE